MATYSLDDLQSYATSEASAWGIPSDMFSAFIQQESGWNPNAVSPKGALGIAQIMPDTAAGHVDPMDAKAAIAWAAKTLHGYFIEFGNWANAFAAYNAGPGNVKKYGGVPPFAETQHYVDVIVNKFIGPVQPLGTSSSADEGGKAAMSSGQSGVVKIVIGASALILFVVAVKYLTQ